MTSGNIRPFEVPDTEQVVDLSLRAWAPVFASMARVFGPDLDRRFHPDWRSEQADGVRKVLEEHETWVWDDSDRVVGFMSVVFDEGARSAEIYMIAVDPDRQRRGVASELMEHGFAEMRSRGIDLVTVSTGGDPGHEPARRAYETMGFTPFPQVFYSRLLD